MRPLRGFLLALPAAVLFFASAATAQECNVSLVTVTAWTASPTNSEIPYIEGSLNLAVQLTSSSERMTQMVEGAVVFTDLLGREIGRVKIDEDAKIGKGQPYYENGTINPSGLDRLAALSSENVVATVCVFAVLYDDGEIERFGPQS